MFTVPHTRRTPLASGLLFALSTSLLTLPGMAQTQDNQDVVLLPDTIVTASAIPLAADKVGSSVSVITAEEIKKRQIRRLSDALALLPGVNITASGGNGNASVFVRGHASGDVLVLIDGVRVNDPSTASSSVDTAQLSMLDIERIEFVKGAQSAVWGSNAVAGVINIITTKATDNSVRASIRAETDFEGSYASTAKVGVRNDRFQFNAALSSRQADGLSAAKNGTEDDRFDQQSASINLRAQLTESADVALGFSRADSLSNFDNPPIDNGNYTDATVDTFWAEGNWQTGLLNHKLYANQSRTDRFVHTEGRFGSDTSFEGKNRVYGYQGTADFVTGNADHAVSLTVERGEQAIRSTSIYAPANKSNDTTEVGLEYNVEINALNLGLAARYQDNDLFGSDVTYRASGSYAFANNSRLHGSIGTSVRNPSLTQLYAPSSGNKNLVPQTSKSIDIGYEFPVLNEQIIMDATLFSSEVDNLFGYNPTTFQTINQVGTTKRRGIELSARGDITDDLSFSGAYTYLRSTDEKGAREIRRPAHSLDLGLTYQVNPQLNVGGDLQYRRDNLDKDFSAWPAKVVKLDDYLLVNLRADYQVNQHLNVYGRVENIMDKDYEQVLGYGTYGRRVFFGFEASY